MKNLFILGLLSVLMLAPCAAFCMAASPDTQEIAALLDPLVMRLRQGTPIRQVEQDHAQRMFTQFMDKSEADSADKFINALKMALIDFERHGGWVFRMRLRLEVVGKLMRRLDESYDPFVLFCSIFPAFESGHGHHAWRAFETLLDIDPFLAGHALSWSSRWSRRPSWIIKRLLDDGEFAKAQAAVELVNTDDTGWLETLSYLQERFGNFEESERLCKQIYERNQVHRPLVNLYLRNPQVKDAQGVSYRLRYAEIQAKVFPEGMRSVGLHSFAGAPRDGVITTGLNQLTQMRGIHRGSIMVAIDGYAVSNFEQYQFARDLDAENRFMSLIFWNGKHYVHTIIDFNEFRIEYGVPNRCFGVAIQSYVP